MTQFLKNNRVLLIIIGVCALAAASVIFQRAQIESENKTYDIVVDYDELAALAEQSGHDTVWWLERFKEMGISKVGLMEKSLMTLMEDTPLDVEARVMENVMNKGGWKDELPDEFVEAVDAKGCDSFDVLVTAKGEDAADFVWKGITGRFEDEKYVGLRTDDAAYFLIDSTADMTLFSEDYKYMNSRKGGFAERRDAVASKVMYISLGLLPEEVEQIQSLGMSVIPRTLSYNGWNGTKFADGVKAGYAEYGIVPEYIITGGEAVIGYDDGLDIFMDYLDETGAVIGLIENTTQLQHIFQFGAGDAAVATGYNAVRVFSVWNYIQYRYQYYGYPGAEEIENTLFRAVSERNIRVIYFKPILQNKDLHTYVTNLDDYTQLFANLETRLERHGFNMGEASVMREYHVSRILQIVMGIGAVTGAVLLLCAVLPVGRKASYVLTAVGALGVLAASYVMPNTSVLLTSFGAAVVFGCLAAAFYTAQSRFLQEKDALTLGRIIIFAAATLAASVAIALVGGMMTAAPISSTSYMLEMDIYRGVKVSQLLPIAYFAVAFMAYYGFGSRKRHIGQLELHDIKDLFCLEIKVWMVLALAVVGAMGVYYIARTGHDTAIEATSLEMLFRNKLEEVLLARPRNKEFLFAFPALMLMVYCGAKRMKLWSLVFGMGGVIGMTSVINTFMHIRTPLYLGFVRTGYSLLFGMILGIIAILIFNGIYTLYLRLMPASADKVIAGE